MLLLLPWLQLTNAVSAFHNSSGGGGTLPLEGGTGMCHHHDPLFFRPLQSVLPSLFHHCAAQCPPPIFNLKILHFQPCFWSKLQSSRCKLAEFLLPRPLIFQGKPLPRSFGNPCSTYPPKKFECPPQTVVYILSCTPYIVYLLFFIVCIHFLDVFNSLKYSIIVY